MGSEQNPIKLDPDSDGVLFEPADWLVCSEHFGLMHYLPTGAQYYVDLPKETYAKEQVSPMDFCAWLVHLREESTHAYEAGRTRSRSYRCVPDRTGLLEAEVEIPDRPRNWRKTGNHNKLSS